MSVKENASRKPLRRSGIGSYGHHPRNGRYDHASFLSEMVPVSFQREVSCGACGLTDEMLIQGMTPFPLVHIGLHEAKYMNPVGIGLRH